MTYEDEKIIAEHRKANPNCPMCKYSPLLFTLADFLIVIAVMTAVAVISHQLNA